MRTVIRIRPAARRRRDFAAWAVVQTPKVRTCSEAEFAVPAHLVPQLPEELLVGALVEGQPYMPVDQTGTTEGGTDQQPTAPVGPQPEPLEEPAPEPAGATPSGGQDEASAEPGGRLVCGVGGCARDFGSERARRSHRRQAHPQAHSEAEE